MFRFCAWRPGVAVSALLLGAVTSPCGAQSPATGLQTTIEGKPGSYFEGEPTYLLVTIRNPGLTARAVPTVSALIRFSRTEVRSSAGVDVRRAQAYVDVAGGTAMDTVPPGGTLHWVMPLHWYWGSYQEAAEAWTYFAFAPGRYRVSITFPAEFSVAADSLELVVRQRSSEESRARTAFLAGTKRARTDVQREGDARAALSTIESLYRDPSLSSYAVLLLCDVAGALEGSARSHSSVYRADIDALRAELAVIRSGAEQTRLIQHLAAERLDSLAAAMPALGSVPYVGERLREIRRDRSRP